MSRTVCTYPIVGALRKADDFLGPNREWHAVNDAQRRFLGNAYLPSVGDLAKVPELDAIASESHDVINAYLAERKFSIRLNEFPPGGFGTASILAVKGLWMVPGTKRPVFLNGGDRRYDGFVLKHGVRFTHSERLGIIAHATTQAGDTVNFAPLEPGLSDRDAPDDLALLDLVTSPHSMRVCSDYSSVLVPMVDLDQQPDITWLKKLWTVDDKETQDSWEIAQALQQTKLKMNEMGFLVKSGVALGIMRTAMSHELDPFIIDRPFLIWMVRPGMSLPYFAGYITPEDWKNPGSLED